LSDNFNLVSHPTKCYRKYADLLEGYYQIKLNYKASLTNSSKIKDFSGVKNSAVTLNLN
jgi:hypothetical protein